MPTYLLKNMNTQLGIVNGGQTLVSKIIFDPQDNILFFDLSNFANWSNFLHMAGLQHFVKLTSSHMHIVIHWIYIDDTFAKPST